MKTIKFAADSETEYQFAIAVRRNVNEYFKEKGISTKGNITLTLQTIVMLSLYLVPFILVLVIPMNGWIALLLCVIMGIGMAGVVCA